jgi:hypothetical protein
MVIKIIPIRHFIFLHLKLKSNSPSSRVTAPCESIPIHIITMASEHPETVLLRTPHQTNVIFQHHPHPPMEGIVLLNANGSLAFDLKGVSGQEHRPCPIGLWHLVNLYRKLHGIKESLDPLKCLLVDISNSSACSNFALLYANFKAEVSLKQQSAFELKPEIPDILRQAECRALRRLANGESWDVHFQDVSFPHNIRLDPDGTFTILVCHMENLVNLHSLEVLWYLKQFRLSQDDHSLPSISPFVATNPMYALNMMFFQDLDQYDTIRTLGHRLCLLATEIMGPEPTVPTNIQCEERAQLKDVVKSPTPVRAQESSGSLEVYLMPDGTFEIKLSKSARLFGRTSWGALHWFKRDAFKKGTSDDTDSLQPQIKADPSYALKRLFLETDPSQSLYAIVEEIYSDMPALEEITDSALPNVVEAQPVDCDGNTPQAILERLKQKEAVLRAEIQAYKEIQRQIQTNSQLEAELQQLKVTVGSA